MRERQLTVAGSIEDKHANQHCMRTECVTPVRKTHGMNHGLLVTQQPHKVANRHGIKALAIAKQGQNLFTAEYRTD